MASFNAISGPTYEFIEVLRNANQNHHELLWLRQHIDSNSNHLEKIIFKEGLLLNEFIPHWWEAALVSHGHFTGCLRIFIGRVMRKDVATSVSSCQICQQMKDLLKQPAGLLQPLPIPDLVFEEVTMDFITCLPTSKGKATILTVVDRLSKYGHFIALPSTFTAQSVAAVFVSEIIRVHGPPKTIVTYRYPRFITSFWKEIHRRLQGTTLSMSTAYHPQMDGQSEALNKCVEQYLRCFVVDSPHEWSPLLPWAEYWYNTALQAAAGMTPFQALYGREPPTIPR